MKILLIPAVVIVALAAVYFIFPKPDGNTSVSACVAKCKEVVASGVDTSSGPCLSNEIQRDWVCDMAHNPRTPIDNLPDNQCSEFVKGNAKHFVEVDANCEVVRVY